MSYEKIKHSIKSIIPEQFLFKNEVLFRNIYSQFYSGNKFECNVCGKKLSRFVLNNRNEKSCPNCGSLERDRKLWEVISAEFLKPNITILDFSPSRNLARKLKKIADINYISTDYCGNFLADFKYNITNLELQNDSMDLICCYHILEHIEHDGLAISELFRVLKPNGYAIIQTPFKDGEIYENKLITSESDRLAHFGQEDHVRIYSEEGLANRLKNAGFEVEIRNYVENEKNRFGFATIETQIIAKKV